MLPKALSCQPVKQLIERSFAQIFNSEHVEIVYIDELADHVKNIGSFERLIISDCKRFAPLKPSRIEKIISENNGFTAIEINDDIRAYTEKPRITSDGKIAGFCRLYTDVAVEMSVSNRWPEHLILGKEVADKIDWALAGEKTFGQLVQDAPEQKVSFNLSGNVIDMTEWSGLLNLFDINSDLINKNCFNHSSDIADDIKITGDVIVEKGVTVEEGVVLSGPVILGSGCKIGKGTAISNCIITDGIEIGRESYISNRVITEQQQLDKNIQGQIEQTSVISRAVKGYRRWSRFSYVRFGKRIFDILFSLLVLILFAPILPVIALAVKLTSPGPVFYVAKRQGLRGKQFGCIKFRTMIVGAEDIQSKLRFKNEVDGPQFKIDDDPRISAFGLFLRNTSLDEVPQFFNVLLGDMSIVGPRPSPEDENMRCPYWRDARLSVKPGITGLWQVERTREPSKDFQEWVSYDTKYVRNISFKLDMWICYRTFVKLVTDFLDQF